MRVFIINSVCGVGSTGKIVTDLCDVLKQNGHEVKVAFGIGNATRILSSQTIKISNSTDYYIHNALSRITDRAGFYSIKATKKLIHSIQEFKPDIIHLHNLHGYYLNIRLLFQYLKKANIPVVWTLHDCWALTGHCAHFSYVQCDKWIVGCDHCPQLRSYPKCYAFDSSKRNYVEKKSLFTSIPQMIIITPSEWLASIVQKSFLSIYPLHVISNGIDLNVFKPTKSNFRNEYRVGNKKIVLAVSNVWGEKKGIADIFKLSHFLDYDKYQIIMVGVTESQISLVPKEIIAIQRTSNVQELVEIYSAADVFINPSYEETMGLVTAEALACGTPAVVYDKTAVPEIVDEKSGKIVPAGDIKLFAAAIKSVCEENYFQDAMRSRAAYFEKNQQYEKYIELYKSIAQ